MCNTVTISTAVNKKKLSKISRLNSVFLSPFSFVKEQQKYNARNSSIVREYSLSIRKGFDNLFQYLRLHASNEVVHERSINQ